MFATHQKPIGQFARDNAEGMTQVIQFVLLTIQNTLELVPEQMNDVNELGAESAYLWGDAKRNGWAYLDEHSERIHSEALAIYNGYHDPEVQAKELLRYFAELPGLGLVKAGFVVQLCFGLSGCLDTHNINRFGLSANTFKASRFKAAKTIRTKNKILDLYCDLVEKCGGTEALWNGWCDYVAAKRPKSYASGFEVSQLHCDAIGV